MPLAISIAIYFVVAAALRIPTSPVRRAAVWIAAVPFAVQLVVAAAFFLGDRSTADESLAWIPSLGVTIGLTSTSLTMLLTVIVAGIGLLIVIYSGRYFTDPQRRAKFLSLLAVFSGGMAGIVVSDELLGLFVFWEITTVASYLLIGFNDRKATARAAALQAILITTAGGLAMLAGFIVLAMEAGTTTISSIVEAPPEGTATVVALVLIFAGAFTKSAQWPFHFWLPGAMEAPTPASAYLHSATMVKAGVVLLVFLAPGFDDTTVWLWTVTAVGLITMVVGAVIALRQWDLKLLLAYGTVSQLGFMTALIGLGYTAAAVAVLVAHSLFKSALFLIVGVIDTSTGTRDVRRLSGVGRSVPVLATAGAIAAASMAGIPPMLGFVTKEAAFDVLIADGAWVALIVIAAASALTVAYSWMWWVGAFGQRSTVPAIEVRTPSNAMVGPTVLLGILTVALGIWPTPLAEAINDAFATPVKLVLWPGFKPALAVSAVVVAVGVVVAWALRDGRNLDLPSAASLRLPRGSVVYAASIRWLNTTADIVTGVVQNGSLPVYVSVIVASVLFVPTVTWLFQVTPSFSLPVSNTAAEIVLVAVVIIAALAATRVQRRMAAVLLLGAVGYAIAGIYVLFAAPDLALTQLLIETLTVALFAFVLVKLPRRFGPPPDSLPSWVRIAVAAFAGVFVTAAAVITSTPDHDRSLVDAYVANAEDAGGTNVVNIILTNFRALDTLGEITVLAAAGIGIAALISAARATRRGQES